MALFFIYSPKRGTGNLMKDYLEAEYAGQADFSSCSQLYSTCPISLFNLLRTYSTPADKPVSVHHASQAHGPHNNSHQEDKQIKQAIDDYSPDYDGNAINDISTSSHQNQEQANLLDY